MYEPHLWAWIEAARDCLSRRGESIELKPESADERILPIRQIGNSAVLQITGRLEARAGSFWEYYGMATSYERLADRVRAAAADSSVRQVVLDINSGGGDALGMEEICAVIRDVREAKTIVAVVNPYACSAAYGIASSCTKVVALPSAILGSIGTYLVHMDYSAALELDGVKATVIRSVEGKAGSSGFEPLTPEERASLQQTVDTLGDAFVKAVAKGRGVTAANVRENFGKGRAVMAGAALEARMIDKIGTLEDVLQAGNRGSKQGSTLNSEDGGDPANDGSTAEAIARLNDAVVAAIGGTR